MRWRSLPCFFCSSLILGCSSCIAFEDRRAFTVRGSISVLTMMVKAMMPSPALENRPVRLFNTLTRKSTYWFQIGMLTPIVRFVSPPAPSGVATWTCSYEVAGYLGPSWRRPDAPDARFEVTEPDRIRYRRMDCSARYAR